MSSSLRPSGTLLSPLMNIINGAAASVILAVLMLGVLCARLFGQEQVSKEREPDPEPESNGSNVLANGAQYKDADADASPVCVNGGSETPEQARKSSHAASYPLETDFETDVSPTPPGQMLFAGLGPTPSTPAPAHPAAMTVPAPRTSAPPSPSNILPRNLESLLLAAANSHADDIANRYTASSTSTIETAAERLSQAPPPQLDHDMVEDPPASIPALPVSTPPPPPPPSNAKSDSVVLLDSAQTVPRRAPGTSAAVPAAPRVLTAPFEAAADFGSDSTPAHPSATAPAFASNVATGNNGCFSLGTYAAAAAVAADTPTSSWPTRHDQMNALFRENGDGNGSDGHDSVAMAATVGAAVTAARGPDAWFAVPAAAVAGAAGAEGPLQGGGRAAADVDPHDGHDQQQKQQRQPVAARAPRAGLLAVPVVGLQATLSSPVLEDVTAGETTSTQGRAFARDAAAEQGGAGTGGVAGGGAAEVASPPALVEERVSGGTQQQLPASPPAGMPVAPGLTARNLSKTFVAAGAAEVGTAATGTPQLKGRGTPGPKQPQQQPTRIAGGGAILKGNSNTAATPRAVTGSAKQKRGMTSPTAAGTATTPATARRPVGLEPPVRSPRSGMDKNPVARKLNPNSPKPGASSDAAAVAAVGQDGGAISPVSQLSPRMCDMSAASGFLPRYAAPTAASIARNTQPPAGAGGAGTPLRSNTQKALLTAGMSIGADAGGVGGVGEVGAAEGGATVRRGAHDAQLRQTVSVGVLGV